MISKQGSWKGAMMQQFGLVALGGAIGAALRYTVLAYICQVMGSHG